ncbi:FGGY family carbohydrate kinase [Streptomyces globisporus]|uniref:FGGY family carbohydrate kinase n=1 Tax=Streptomyces globisporus TaxID=1908 RepID=UPI0004C7DF1C|nr:FGGY family carbohydrate kinase [Streptomyces globisporus]
MVLWPAGTVGAEETNASTTGLFDVHAGAWSEALPGRLAIAPGALPPLRSPGGPAGELLLHITEFTGLGTPTPVTVVASHDTAPAVAAVPATDPDFAYVSCGTWPRAELEPDSPVLTEESRAADATGPPVVAGPVEATTPGDALVQAHAAGLLGGLGSMRRLVARTRPLRHYVPQDDGAARDRAAARLEPSPRNQ